jgi:JmjC domain, hydroxylase
MDLHSVNYLHYGACKSWYAIPPSHRVRFEQLVKGLLPDLFRTCPEFFRHKVLPYCRRHPPACRLHLASSPASPCSRCGKHGVVAALLQAVTRRRVLVMAACFGGVCPASLPLAGRRVGHCSSGAAMLRVRSRLRRHWAELKAGTPWIGVPWAAQELLISPYMLEQYNIPVVRLVQRPGEFIINYPGNHNNDAGQS